ncbi:MAG: M56 family metallopeptidase, partial [Planctomycetota bacterium]
MFSWVVSTCVYLLLLAVASEVIGRWTRRCDSRIHAGVWFATLNLMLAVPLTAQFEFWSINLPAEARTISSIKDLPQYDQSLEDSPKEPSISSASTESSSENSVLAIKEAVSFQREEVGIPSQRPSWPVIAIVVYCLGGCWAAIQLVKVMLLHWMQWRSASSVERIQARLDSIAKIHVPRSSLAVRIHHDVYSPVLIGCLRPRLLVPSGFELWTDDEQAAVLLHELAHAKRLDHLKQLSLWLNSVVFWFHPAAWWSRRRYVEAREWAADEQASLWSHSGDETIGRSLYPQALLNAASRLGNPVRRIDDEAALLMSGGPAMERRLRRIVDETANRFARRPQLLIVLASLLGLVALVSTTTIRLVRSPANTERSTEDVTLSEELETYRETPFSHELPVTNDLFEYLASARITRAKRDEDSSVSVRGRICDEAGDPCAECTVMLFEHRLVLTSNRGQYSTRTHLISRTITTSEGIYEFGSVKRVRIPSEDRSDQIMPKSSVQIVAFKEGAGMIRSV